jgi:hypothetical protein
MRCNAEDDTMPVPGFERRTFMCSACHDVERHLVFIIIMRRYPFQTSKRQRAHADGGQATVRCASFSSPG